MSFFGDLMSEVSGRFGSMTALEKGLMFGGAGLQLGGGLYSGLERRGALANQKEALLNQNAMNQAIAAQNAAYTLAVGEFNAAAVMTETQIAEDRVRREHRRRVGATTARLGASGVDVTVGSPMDVIADQVAEGELQAQLVRFGGEERAKRERFGAEVSAHRTRVSALAQQFSTDLRVEALDRQMDSAVTNAFVGSAFNAAGTILGGFA